jgi:hypothetical protein
MDWDEYKKLCEQPNYWSLWMLRECLEIVSSQNCAELTATINSVLGSVPLSRPADHKGPSETQMYNIDLLCDLSEALLIEIEKSFVLGTLTQGVREIDLRGFVDACKALVVYAHSQRIDPLVNSVGCVENHV